MTHHSLALQLRKKKMTPITLRVDRKTVYRMLRTKHPRVYPYEALVLSRRPLAPLNDVSPSGRFPLFRTYNPPVIGQKILPGAFPPTCTVWAPQPYLCVSYNLNHFARCISLPMAVYIYQVNFAYNRPIRGGDIDTPDVHCGNAKWPTKDSPVHMVRSSPISAY